MRRRTPTPGTGLSRRRFLGGSAVAAAAVALPLPACLPDRGTTVQPAAVPAVPHSFAWFEQHYPSARTAYLTATTQAVSVINLRR